MLLSMNITACTTIQFGSSHDNSSEFDFELNPNRYVLLLFIET
jgi:hypothetical protein